MSLTMFATALVTICFQHRQIVGKPEKQKSTASTRSHRSLSYALGVRRPGRRIRPFGAFAAIAAVSYERYTS